MLRNKINFVSFDSIFRKTLVFSLLNKVINIIFFQISFLVLHSTFISIILSILISQFSYLYFTSKLYKFRWNCYSFAFHAFLTISMSYILFLLVNVAQYYLSLSPQLSQPVLVLVLSYINYLIIRFFVMIKKSSNDD
jgi:hypothetical protein